ncbi:MAG: DUF547 domain-containing protein [Pseudomonadales bacterium]|nr:DUF547 domain-containing protein [Pseudomonadales bacterium]
MRLLCLCVLMFLLAGWSALPALAQEPDWRSWAKVLSAHVSQGERDGISANLVDYDAIAGDPDFDTAVEVVTTFDVARLEGRNERIAFYINAYNLLTIRLVLDHRPIDSIRDIGNFLYGPWDRVVLSNGEGRLTLDDIEHRILRKMGEPRIHFALNCASMSCPDLRTEPYSGAGLDRQLEEQAERFVGGKGVDVQGGQLRVSRIFDWYGDDFGGEDGVVDFLHARGQAIDLKAIDGYLPYDWSLNIK